MGPGRGRKKRRKLLEIKRKDIISSLPDEVLGRILSLLPTKYAVATCVLSSRWSNLYQLSGTLDFDDSMSFNPKVYLSSTNRIASFWKFVSKVLEQCQRSQISKFRLKCGNKVGYYLVSEWLNAVFLHKVTVIELSVEMVTPYVLQLPNSISQTLVELKLDCNFIFRASKFVSFPSLKVLFFKEVTFPGESSVVFPCNGEFRLDGLNGILCGCPLLEELVIIGCDWNGGDLFFCNPLLKKLTLDVGLRGALDQLDGSSIYFNVPSLVYLKYNESLAEQYVIKNLNSVVDAHFEVGFNDDDYEDTQDLCNTMLDLIVGVCKCEFLYLSRHCLEALASGEFELPVFQNLTRLKLCQGNDVSWNDVLLVFLKSSPGLEALTLVQGCDGEVDGDFSLNDNPIPSCVKSRLKVITLENFTGFRGELVMVNYCLENAAILEEMVIHWKKRNRAREKLILNFPKASKTCSISFK